MKILIVLLLLSVAVFAQDSTSSVTYINTGKVNMDVIVRSPGHTYYEINGKSVHTVTSENSSYTFGNNKEVFTTGKMTPATEAIILNEILKDDKSYSKKKKK